MPAEIIDFGKASFRRAVHRCHENMARGCLEALREAWGQIAPGERREAARQMMARRAGTLSDVEFCQWADDFEARVPAVRAARTRHLLEWARRCILEMQARIDEDAGDEDTSARDGGGA